MCKTGCQMNTSKCLTLLWACKYNAIQEKVQLEAKKTTQSTNQACKYNAIQEKVQLEAKKTTQSTTDAYKFKWGGHL